MPPQLYFLIGFPGSGKSTMGRRWARKKELAFVDLDAYIEEHAGKTIPEIFAEVGEAGFREQEKVALSQLIATITQPSLIACGGGTPCFHDNLQRMKQAGMTIFLHTPLEFLLQRLSHSQTSRPLFAALTAAERTAKILELYEKRLPCYLQADRVVYQSLDELDV